MTPLPPALKPWEAELSAFDADVAKALGPWLVRLSLALGPLHQPRRAGNDEHFGFAGVTRRGSYERLLLSEWSMADAYPEEFERRAAMGELLFLEPDRRDPVGGARSVAIFDCGPDQLGTPRLAHLAIAVALAKRAERAGVPFAISALDRDEPIPWEGPKTAEKLLRARTDRRQPEKPAQWLAYLRAAGVVDRWLIAAKHPGWDGHAVVVAPQGQQLEVAVRGPVSVTVTLDLPPADVAIRCLRDPWARAVSPRTGFQGGPTAGMRFSADGRRLIAAMADGRLVAFHIPNSPRTSPGHPRPLDNAQPDAVRAAAWQGKRWVWLEEETGGFVRPMHWRPADDRRFSMADCGFESGGTGPPVELLVGAHGLAWMPKGDDGPLYLWPRPGGPQRVVERVCAVVAVSGSLQGIAFDGVGMWRVWRLGAPQIDPKTAYIAEGTASGYWAATGDLLYRNEVDGWLIRRSNGAHAPVYVPSGARIIGMLGTSPLFVDGRAVHACEGGKTRPRFTVDEDIRDVVVSLTGQVAVRTKSGALHVWSPAFDQVLLRVDAAAVTP